MKIERASVRRIKPYATHLAHELRRQIAILGRFLDEDAGGADARAGFGFAVDDCDFETAQRGGARAGEPRKTSADDDEIELLQPWPIPARLSQGHAISWRDYGEVRCAERRRSLW